jgi:hypothetical protein
MPLTARSFAPVVLLPLAFGCAAPKYGVLRVSGTPDDALITVDDQYVGKLGRLKRFGVKVPEGEHRLTVEAQGHFPKDALVTIPREGEAKVDVKLDAIPE